MAPNIDLTLYLVMIPLVAYIDIVYFIAINFRHYRNFDTIHKYDNISKSN